MVHRYDILAHRVLGESAPQLHEDLWGLYRMECDTFPDYPTLHTVSDVETFIAQLTRLEYVRNGLRSI